jgi:hypothetical protein
MRTAKPPKDPHVLSVKEIYKRFPDEWILLSDPDVDRYQQVKRGKLVYHSKDRDEVYQKAIQLRLRHSATLFTGGPPEDMEFLL